MAGLCLEDCPWPVHRALGVWSLGEAVLCPLHRQGCVPGKSAGPVLNGERAWCWALAAGIRLSPALTSAPHVEQHRLVPPLVAGRVLPTVLDLWGPWVLTQRAGDVAFTLCVAQHPFWIFVRGTHLSTLCHVLCVPAPSARGEGTVWARPVRGPGGPSSAAGVRLRRPTHCGQARSPGPVVAGPLLLPWAAFCREPQKTSCTAYLSFRRKWLHSALHLDINAWPSIFTADLTGRAQGRPASPWRGPPGLGPLPPVCTPHKWFK